VFRLQCSGFWVSTGLPCALTFNRTYGAYVIPICATIRLAPDLPECHYCVSLTVSVHGCEQRNVRHMPRISTQTEILCIKISTIFFQREEGTGRKHVNSVITSLPLSSHTHTHTHTHTHIYIYIYIYIY